VRFFSVKQQAAAGACATIPQEARLGLDMGAMRKRIRTWGLLLALALPMSSCGSDGDECERCSSDDDCAAGFVCSSFSDGSKRCGTGMGTSCRVR
jgi:hypothetical protein